MTVLHGIKDKYSLFQMADTAKILNFIIPDVSAPRDMQPKIIPV